MAIELIITDAGMAEVLNNDQNGFGPTLVTEIGLGTGVWTPDHTATALQAEFKRLTAIAGGSADPVTLHVSGLDTAIGAYDAYEIGLYLDSGTLFALVSQPLPIVSKAETNSAAVSADVKMLGQIEPAMVTFGDTNFEWASATEVIEGLIRLATQAEAIAGTVDDAAITPKTLSDVVGSVAQAANKAPTAAPTKGGIYTWTDGATHTATIEMPPTGGINLRFFIDGADSTGMHLQSWDGSSWTTGLTLPTTASLPDVLDSIRPYATQAQAQAGSDNATVMTPLRTAQAITSQRPLATQVQAEDGVSNSAVMTPLRSTQFADKNLAYKGVITQAQWTALSQPPPAGLWLVENGGGANWYNLLVSWGVNTNPNSAFGVVIEPSTRLICEAVFSGGVAMHGIGVPLRRALDTDARAGTSQLHTMTPQTTREAITYDATRAAGSGGPASNGYYELGVGGNFKVIEEWGQATTTSSGSVTVPIRAGTSYSFTMVQVMVSSTVVGAIASCSGVITSGEVTINLRDHTGAAVGGTVFWRYSVRVNV